jgi:hypothetical protein
MYTMLDKWDDVDCADIPATAPSADQLRLLAERKLVEDADIELTQDLFSITQTVTERNAKDTAKKGIIQITGKHSGHTKVNKKVDPSLKQMETNHKLTRGNQAGL